MNLLTVNTPIAPVRRAGLGLLIVALLISVACVSQETYDSTRLEADELGRALGAARSELQELEQRIAAAHALNERDNVALADLRAAIQQEQEMAPVMRQRAEDTLAALQTQVAHLINQNRQLGREMADAKQERVSLQAMMAHYKEEVDSTRLLPSSFASSPYSTAAPALPAPSPALASVASAAPVSPVPSARPVPSQSNLPTKSATGTRLVKPEPAQSDDSWSGMIKNWVSSLWGWIFG